MEDGYYWVEPSKGAEPQIWSWSQLGQWKNGKQPYRVLSKRLRPPGTQPSE